MYEREVNSMSVTAFIGIVAAFCTTVAFVPQIVKLRKQGGRRLVVCHVVSLSAGVLLWLAYGIRIHAVADDVGERSGGGAGADIHCAEGQSAGRNS